MAGFDTVLSAGKRLKDRRKIVDDEIKMEHCDTIITIQDVADAMKECCKEKATPDATIFGMKVFVRPDSFFKDMKTKDGRPANMILIDRSKFKMEVPKLSLSTFDKSETDCYDDKMDDDFVPGIEERGNEIWTTSGTSTTRKRCWKVCETISRPALRGNCVYGSTGRNTTGSCGRWKTS